MRKRKTGLLFVLTFFLIGCGLNPTMGMENAEKKQESTGFEVAGVDTYDSMDVAIVNEINYEEKTISLINTKVSRTYTLVYDGATRFFDKNGVSLAAMQVHEGDVVEVTFYKSKKRLNTLQLYKDAWVMEGVTGFAIAESGKVVEIYAEKYRFTDNSIVIMPDGRGELMDINQTDTITVVGIDHEISSITVTKGHGYLRLANDSNVIGGWIEVGNNIIQPIIEDMLLLIPEGEYGVIVSVGNASLKQTVSIKRDQETVFDCISFEPEEIQYGSILFTVDPENTSVYIDGAKVDISVPVELSYGIHQMIARASGYDTMSKYIKVGSEYATLAVLLEQSDSGEEKEKEEVTEEETETGKDESEETSKNPDGTTTESKESEESSEKTEESTQTEETATGESKESETTSEVVDTTVASTSYRVYVDAPSDVEVYMDGAYVGLSPVNFKKTAGTHTITLRKTGYITRSYTIQIDEEEKDVSYSFSELEKSTE